MLRDEGAVTPWGTTASPLQCSELGYECPCQERDERLLELAWQCPPRAADPRETQETLACCKSRFSGWWALEWERGAGFELI